MENSKRRSIPMQEKLKLSKSQGASTPAKMKCMQNVPYASAVGSIMYAVRCTGPNVAFAHNITSRFQQNPGDIYWTTVKNILKYLRNTKDMFLTGYVFVLNGGAVDWKSAKQSIFATSSAEAEYIAAFDASKEAVWVRKFISGLGVVPTVEEPISMYCDNTRAIAIANESGITKGARHFRAKVHYLREVIEFGDIKLKKVHTYDNLAYPFTKALPFPKHFEHTRNIGMLPASSLMLIRGEHRSKTGPDRPRPDRDRDRNGPKCQTEDQTEMVRSSPGQVSAIYTSPFGQAIYTSPFGQAIYTSPFGQAIYTSHFGQEIYMYHFGQEIYTHLFGQEIYTEHERMILESVEHGPLIWLMIEENGVIRTKKYAELYVAEKIQADCDMKATNIILQVNTKFLNSLPPEWSKFVTDVKLVKDLHTSNYGKLHAYLEQNELHANEVRLMLERNQDPLAFVANQQMTPPHFNTYHSFYNNPQLQQQFSPSQQGSTQPHEHYSSHYPSPTQFNHSSIPPSHSFQSHVNHQTSTVLQTDSGIAVLVFKQGDDLIDAINKMISFMSTIVSSRFPNTNNQLRNSSNPRQQATIHDGRVTI
nr:hypothetical protein [Tanacetum cinerariifolium]